MKKQLGIIVHKEEHSNNGGVIVCQIIRLSTKKRMIFHLVHH
jgi:hypothetical protein